MSRVGNNRIRKFLFALEPETAALVTDKSNIRYLTGFRGDDSFLLVAGGLKCIITDGRYADEVAETLRGFKVKILSKRTNLADILKGLLEKHGVKRLFLEEYNVRLDLYLNLKKRLRGVKIEPLGRILKSFRAVKDESEIAFIKKSVKIAETALKSFDIGNIRGLKISERGFAGKIEERIIELKGDGSSFDIIVASGENSAYPHHVSGPKIIKSGILLIDFGARFSGYCSDLTRTFFLGRMTRRFKDTYGYVSEAQNIACSLIKDGVSAAYVEEKVREYFKKKGVERFFNHSLGHGVGIDIHEEPFYSRRYILRENMVLTVEPGIYVRGWGGIRIEDMVLVTKRGCEKLTKLPYVSL